MRYFYLTAAVVLAGCLQVSEPVVSAYNGNSVSIQSPGLDPTSPPAPSDVALASKTCGKPARFASGRMVADARVEYLFIC